MTVLAKLVAINKDCFGYITYVFKRLEDFTEESKYIMCTQYPNWNQKEIKLDDEGYLSFVEITAGEDKWFDGNVMVPYNYNAIQFLKFIPKDSSEHSYIMLIIL